MRMKHNVAIIGGWPTAGGWTRAATDTTELNGNDSYQVFNNSYTQDAPLTNTAVLYAAKVANGNSGSFGSGGGMRNYYASPVIMNVTFSSNRAGVGSGMYNDRSSPVLTNVTFVRNTISGSAGGMYNDRSSPVLTNVTFTNNTAGIGGGMLNEYSSPVLTNVTFSNNTANNGGGGMYNSSNESSPVVTNSIFWGNAAPTDAQYTGTGTSITNSVVQDYGTASNNNTGDDPSLTELKAYGGYVNAVGFSGSSPVNIGLYVKRSKNSTGTEGDAAAGEARPKYTFYYSENGTAWFSDQALTTATTLVEPTVDLTAKDATGEARRGRPDAGAWEKP